MNHRIAKELSEAKIICRILNLSEWDAEGPRDARGLVKYLRRRGLCRVCFSYENHAEIWTAIVALYLEKKAITVDAICERLRATLSPMFYGKEESIEDYVRDLATCEWEGDTEWEDLERVLSRRVAK